MKKPFIFLAACGLTVSLASTPVLAAAAPGATPSTQAAQAVQENYTVSGLIHSFDGKTLVVTSDEGTQMTFDVTQAQLECKNGILSNDDVTVEYIQAEGQEAVFHAVKVEDKADDSSRKETELFGTVENVSTNTVTIKNLYGHHYTFSTVGAETKSKSGMKKGSMIMLTYKGEVKNGKTDNVKVLSITDEIDNKKLSAAKKKAENVLKKQEAAKKKKQEEAAAKAAAAAAPKVTIAEVSKTMYTSVESNVRESYTTGSNKLGTLALGAQVDVTGTCDNGWIRIAYQGKTGYVYGDLLQDNKPVMVQDNYAVLYATNPVNVRSGAGTEYQVLGQLSKGEAIQETGICDNGWIRVSYNGGVGFVYGDYLTDQKPVETRQIVSVYGYVANVGMSALSIDTQDALMSFDISNAEMDCLNGICEGNLVEVNYYAGTTTAVSVIDNEANQISQPGFSDAGLPTMGGTVVGATMGTITLMLNDGATLTFLKDDNTQVEISQGIYEGEYVYVEYQPAGVGSVYDTAVVIYS